MNLSFVIVFIIQFLIYLITKNEYPYETDGIQDQRKTTFEGRQESMIMIRMIKV